MFVDVETISIVAPEFETPMGAPVRRKKRPVGSFTCRVCGCTVVFSKAAKLLLYSYRHRRIVLVNPETKARYHDCTVDKLYMCETCEEPREVRAWRGVANLKCYVCGSSLQMIQQPKRKPLVVPLDQF